MNRADRRRAARMARRRRTGWLHRLSSARSQGAVEGGKVYTSAIERDAWCDIHSRRGCNCVPTISIHPLDGAT
jgi:hypothetical protein